MCVGANYTVDDSQVSVSVLSAGSVPRPSPQSPTLHTEVESKNCLLSESTGQQGSRQEVKGEPKVTSGAAAGKKRVKGP